MAIVDLLTRLIIGAVQSPAGQAAGRYVLRQGTAAIIRAVQNKTKNHRKSGRISVT